MGSWTMGMFPSNQKKKVRCNNDEFGPNHADPARHHFYSRPHRRKRNYPPPPQLRPVPAKIQIIHQTHLCLLNKNADIVNSKCSPVKDCVHVKKIINLEKSRIIIVLIYFVVSTRM